MQPSSPGGAAGGPRVSAVAASPSTARVVPLRPSVARFAVPSSSGGQAAAPVPTQAPSLQSSASSSSLPGGVAAAAAGEPRSLVHSHSGNFRSGSSGSSLIQNLTLSVRSSLPTIKRGELLKTEEAVCEGWLEKQSPAIGKSWQRRWFVLRGNALFYWKDREVGPNTHTGSILLLGSTTVSNLKKKGSKVHFNIVTDQRKYKLRADEHDSARTWIQMCDSIIHERKRLDDDNDKSISVPYGVVHRSHVDFDYNWIGPDPDQVFSVCAKLGEGAYGSVWRAEHKETGFVVALKKVPLGGVAVGASSLQKEIDVLRQCKHRSIVSYFGSSIKDDDIWIYMEHCSLGSVRDVMQSCVTNLEEPQLAYICLSTLTGLTYLHALNMVHFDVKAANILMDEKCSIKLADFGVSEQMGTFEGRAGHIIGSPLWMSPEVILKETWTSNTDIWSLGITVIEMADGRAPHSGHNPMEVIKVIPTIPPPTVSKPRQWSSDFNDFLARCLTKDAKERPLAVDLLMHPYIQKAKGKEVLVNLVADCLRNQDRRRREQEQPPT